MLDESGGTIVYKMKLSFFVTKPLVHMHKVIEELKKENTKFEVTSDWSKHPISGIPFKSVKEVPVAEFFCETTSGNSTGFLLKDYPRFCELCRKYSISSNEFKVIELPDYAPVKVDFGLDKFSPRPKQLPAIEHLKRLGDTRVSVLEAATGFGKSVLGLYMMALCGERTMFSMNPGHLATWKNSLKQFTNVTDDDIYMFDSGESIRKAIMLAREGKFDYKIIMTSSATTRSFIKQFENNETSEFNFEETPAGIWALLGIGLVVRDEVHEAIHALVRQTIYTTAPKSLYLSATLISDDRFINSIYDKVFPQSTRWKSENNRYLMMYPLFYTTRKHISGRGFKGYSHISYEKAIMRTKTTLDRYLNLIMFVVDLWERDYKPGKKMMIIAANVKMCELIRDRVKATKPDKSCETFVQGSPKEHLYERDIIVGTPTSIGTGRDVPNLSMVFLTVAIGSTQRSIQIAGRPREIALYPEDFPRFVYLVNRNTAAHMKYHEKRLGYMTPRIKGKKDIFSNYIV